MSEKPSRWVIALLLAVIPATARVQPAAAEDHFHPFGFVDLYTGGMVKLDWHFAVGDNIVGYLPELTAQYGIGNWAFGLDWGMSIADPDGGDAGFFPGNFVLNLKGKHCIPGTWTTCLGAELEIGIGPFEPDDNEQLLGWLVGWFNHTLRPARYFPESLVFDPVFVVQTTNGQLWAQFYLGPSFLVALDDTDNGLRDEVEVALVYGFDLGIRFQNLVAFGVSFHGTSTLTKVPIFDVFAVENESLFEFAFGLRLLLDGASPGFRIAIPFDTFPGEGLFDVLITLGVLFEF